MNGNILSIATAVPKFAISQKAALEKTFELSPFSDQEMVVVKKLYENSGINTRYSVIEDFLKKPADSQFLGPKYPESIPGMSTRNAIYKQEAAALAHNAAEKAIQSWGGNPAEITHVISVSCTGVVIPGIEFALISSLHLKSSVYRLGINFMGCFGAFKALDVANAFAQQNPNNRILIVCTELCSLHIQKNDCQDSLVANSIFADGAAAAIIGANPKPNEIPLWEMVKHSSFALNDSGEQMRWEASDHGFVMKLSNFVPISISRHIRSFAEELLQLHTTLDMCDWPIHPGGKAILQTIEKKLELNKSQTISACDTLANYGNMSSATFLFVLDNLSKKSEKREWAAGLGFGPGLSIEGILLRNEKCKNK